MNAWLCDHCYGVVTLEIFFGVAPLDVHVRPFGHVCKK